MWEAVPVHGIRTGRHYIEAVPPELYKQASVPAIRCPDDDRRSQYLVLQVDGNGAAVKEAITRYNTINGQLDSPGLESLTINPITYNCVLRLK